MPGKKDTATENPQLPEVPNAEGVARSLGLIFSNISLYGAAHGVTKQSIKNAYTVITNAMEKCNEICFSVAEEQLMLNGREVEQKNPLVKGLVTYLSDREASGFSFIKGLSENEFEEIIKLMALPAEQLKERGGLAAKLRESDVQHMGVKQVVYKAVTEDEVVVSKATFMETGLATEEVLKLLKGEKGLDNEKASDAVRQAAKDPTKLAELIVEAVEEKEAGRTGAVSFAEVLTGCIRNVFEALIKDESANTKKGKQDIRKILLTLEKELAIKLRELHPQAVEEETGILSEAVEEMVDELQMDTLAAEYQRRRKLVNESEKRLLRYIKSKSTMKIDQSELQRKLVESGLTLEEWNELMVKSGLVEIAASGGVEAVEIVASITNIAKMLSKLSEIAHAGVSSGTVTGEKSAGNISEVVQELDTEIKKFASRATQSIIALEDVIKLEDTQDLFIPEEQRSEVIKAKIKRRHRLMELLAEIGQEFCQPLAVIMSVLEMVMSGTFGALTESQTEMLKLASTSSQRLRQLADKLVEISGVPTTLVPDIKLVESLYEEKK